jgi:hypothetical protein
MPRTDARKTDRSHGDPRGLTSPRASHGLGHDCDLIVFIFFKLSTGKVFLNLSLGFRFLRLFTGRIRIRVPPRRQAPARPPIE